MTTQAGGGRLWVPLDVDFQNDPKILAAGAHAELIYVRSLALAKRLMCDGFVSEHHVEGLSNGLSLNRNRLKNAVSALVREGLWTPVEGGWRIAGWLNRNPSVESIATKSQVKRSAGRKANHERWHVGPNGTPNPECEWCPTSDPNRIRIGSQIASKETETETETETEVLTSDTCSSQCDPTEPARAVGTGLAIVDQTKPAPVDGFEAWWQAYPRKVGKPKAASAWRNLTRTDQRAAVEGLTPWARYWATRGDPQYVPHPTTWLNRRGWEDQLPTKTGPTMDSGTAHVLELMRRAQANGGGAA